MKDTGRKEIDEERISIIQEIDHLLSAGHKAQKEDLIKAKQRLMNYRYKLAYYKGTEMLETQFGWTAGFEERINKIDELLKK